MCIYKENLLKKSLFPLYKYYTYNMKSTRKKFRRFPVLTYDNLKLIFKILLIRF